MLFINRLVQRIHCIGARSFHWHCGAHPDAIIFETDDEPRMYALVFLSWSPCVIKRKRGDDPKTVLLSGREAIQARMDIDNTEWVAQFR